jgi:hypothetical protein
MGIFCQNGYFLMALIVWEVKALAVRRAIRKTVDIVWKVKL